MGNTLFNAVNVNSGKNVVDSIMGVSGLKSAADNVNQALVGSILADQTLDAIHGSFVSLNTGLNFLIGVVVVMILICIFFITYHGMETESIPEMTNNIVTLVLAASVAISFLILKFTFSTLDDILFDDKSGILPVAKDLMVLGDAREESRKPIISDDENASLLGNDKNDVINDE